jgi:hypothetical protein
MTAFEHRYRDSLLARYPEWRDPGRLLSRPTGPARRRQWLWAVAAVAAALAAVVVRPSAGGRGSAHLLPWPSGFNAGANLALANGWLVLYEGHRAAGLSAAAPPRPAWTVTLGGRIQGAAALADGQTLLVTMQDRALWAADINRQGVVTARTRLGPVAPSSRVWVAAAPWGAFLVSTRTVTWEVGAGGRVGTRLTGGSNAVALAQGYVATWDPATDQLRVWTKQGRPIWTVREPDNLGPATLAPVDTGPGFAFVMPRRIVVPYPIGLIPAALAQGGPWQFPAGLLTRQALVLAGAGSLRTVLWSAPTGAVLPRLAPGRPLALTANGVLILARRGHLVAETLGGRVLGTVAQTPRASVAGVRYAYVATRPGLLAWGPFVLPPTRPAFRWTATAGPWTAVFRLAPTMAPVVYNGLGGLYQPRSQVMMPAGVPYLAAAGPDFLNLLGVLSLRYHGADAARVTTLALRPPKSALWLFVVANPIQTSAPRLLLAPPGGRPGFQQRQAWATTDLVWEAMRRGWLRIPAHFAVQLGWGAAPAPLTWVSLPFVLSR